MQALYRDEESRAARPFSQKAEMLLYPGRMSARGSELMMIKVDAQRDRCSQQMDHGSDRVQQDAESEQRTKVYTTLSIV